MSRRVRAPGSEPARPAAPRVRTVATPFCVSLARGRYHRGLQPAMRVCHNTSYLCSTGDSEMAPQVVGIAQNGLETRHPASLGVALNSARLAQGVDPGLERLALFGAHRGARA